MPFWKGARDRSAERPHHRDDTDFDRFRFDGGGIDGFTASAARRPRLSRLLP